MFITIISILNSLQKNNNQREETIPFLVTQALKNKDFTTLTVVTKKAGFTSPEHASCVFWFEKSNSITIVQQNFRTEYGKNPPSRSTIYEQHNCFFETGCSVNKNY